MPPRGPRRAAPRPPRARESQPTISDNINPSSPVVDPALQNVSAQTTSSAISTAGLSISPPRPPVQRLQSLNKRTPSGSIVPRPSLASDDPNQAKPELKYRPRAVGRRSKEERDEIQRLEEIRNQERLAEAAAVQRGRASSRPGGRGGLGRGRAGLLNTGASGPLGSGAASSVTARTRGAYGRRLGPDSGASSTSRHSGKKSTASKGHRMTNVSSDESDSGIRVSIDQINIDSDQDLETPIKKKDKGKKPVRRLTTREKGLRPIRVERHEHEERVIGIHTEPGSSTVAEERRETKEKALMDNEGLQSEEQVSQIKQEPVDDGFLVSDMAPQTEESSTVPDRLSSKPLKPRPHNDVGIKDPNNSLRTREEIEEFERQAYDRKMLRDLLCVSDETPQPDETTTEPQDAGDPEGEEKVTNDKRSGQLFLIQFPPLIPNLLIAGAAKHEDALSVQQNQNADDDVTITGSNLRPDPAFKQEEDGPDVTEVTEASPNSSSQQQASKLVTAIQPQLPAGRIGRLNLHESGRVTLDWGGISFELDMATEVNFLQEAVVTSSSPSTAATTATSLPAVGEDSTPPEEKKVWALGQLSGRFVVMPNWDKLL